jgi:hypothetical protein
MKKAKSMKSGWSSNDLQEYLAEAVNAHKIGRDWPNSTGHVDQGPAKGGGADGSDQPETPHLASGLVVARRIQVVREYLMAIPRLLQGRSNLLIEDLQGLKMLF